MGTQPSDEVLDAWNRAVEIVDQFRPFGGHRCTDPANAEICITCRYTEALKARMRLERDKLYSVVGRK